MVKKLEKKKRDYDMIWMKDRINFEDCKII